MTKFLKFASTCAKILAYFSIRIDFSILYIHFSKHPTSDN